MTYEEQVKKNRAAALQLEKDMQELKTAFADLEAAKAVASPEVLEVVVEEQIELLRSLARTAQKTHHKEALERFLGYCTDLVPYIKGEKQGPEPKADYYDYCANDNNELWRKISSNAQHLYYLDMRMKGSKTTYCLVDFALLKITNIVFGYFTASRP
jgi:hypothetical protein